MSKLSSLTINNIEDLLFNNGHLNLFACKDPKKSYERK